MAFVEVQFPADISPGSAGGPGWQTTVITLQSGYEKRIQRWAGDRGRWDVGYGIRSYTDLQTVAAFFNARAGKANGFRFKDWLDFQAFGESIGTGDNSETDFQLVKTYVSGGVTYTKTITKPVAGTVFVYLDGALQSSGYSVDTTTGVVTFSTPPGNNVVVSADFEFDKPARFDIDNLSVSLEDLEMGNVPQIPIVEIRT